MKRIGIVGGGISGLHLGLWLREYGLDATIYSEKTSSQLLDAPLRNIVIRNACTRQRERDLRVNHWDDTARDLGTLSVTVAGTPIAFAGTLAPPSNVVDMRIYCARLLGDFSTRGGHVVIGTVMCRFALPVSDACNARLKPPPPHVGRLLGAAAQQQRLADFYAFGFNHPDRYWEVVSSEERTDALLQQATVGRA